MWIVFLILSGVCLAIGFAFPSKKESDETGQTTALTPLSTVQVTPSMPNTPMLSQWDEPTISRELDALRGQSPAVVSNYIESIKQRMVINQNDKTAAVRARFLKTKLEELKLIKEGRQIMVDLETLVLEREKRLKTLELDNQELDNKKKLLDTRQQMEALKQQKMLELEIAQLDKQISEIKSPPKPESKPSPEQLRAKERAECEAKIEDLKKQKQAALKIADEDERVHRVNAFDAAIQREYERWSKLL